MAQEPTCAQVTGNQSFIWRQRVGWVLRHYGKPVRFPVESKGEWLAILRWKVVSTSPLKRPNWFARDCVTAAQSQSEKYLRRMCWSKGEWLAILQSSCPCFVTQLPLLVGKHEIPIRLIVSESLIICLNRRQAPLSTSRLVRANLLITALPIRSTPCDETARPFRLDPPSFLCRSTSLRARKNFQPEFGPAFGRGKLT
jgi:hypothetical protein